MDDTKQRFFKDKFSKFMQSNHTFKNQLKRSVNWNRVYYKLLSLHKKVYVEEKFKK
jgi:hypothetical protein